MIGHWQNVLTCSWQLLDERKKKKKETSLKCTYSKVQFATVSQRFSTLGGGENSGSGPKLDRLSLATISIANLAKSWQPLS